MIKVSKLYLAYGSNLNEGQMKNRCPSARKVGSTHLNDYELEFRTYLTIKKSKGKQVLIGVWEIQDSDERNLDYYEGYPKFYRKEWVEVEINGKLKKAMVYIMNESTRPISYPFKSYLETCLKGYEDFQFDSSYLFEALEKAK